MARDDDRDGRRNGKIGIVCLGILNDVCCVVSWLVFVWSGFAHKDNIEPSPMLENRSMRCDASSNVMKRAYR